MRIYTRKYVKEAIPIVPMLDILTILLIFFIVQTEFKHQSTVLKLALPETKSLAGEQGDKNNILLEIGEDGKLALDGRLIPIDGLAQALTELQQKHPMVKIQLHAAKGASMGQFIQTMDELNASGLDIEEVPVRINYQSPQ